MDCRPRARAALPPRPTRGLALRFHAVNEPKNPGNSAPRRETGRCTRKPECALESIAWGFAGQCHGFAYESRNVVQNEQDSDLYPPAGRVGRFRAALRRDATNETDPGHAFRGRELALPDYCLAGFWPASGWRRTGSLRQPRPASATPLERGAPPTAGQRLSGSSLHPRVCRRRGYFKLRSNSM